VKRWRLGLVVGKFSPLHNGHELLIDTALSECEAVRVLSYVKPSLPKCPPAVRRAWLERRFPNARILVLDEDTLAGRHDAPPWPEDYADELLHRRFVGYLCREVLGERPDVVFTSEAYGPGFAAELARYFETRDGSGPCQQSGVRVAHVAVDPARARVPISGTRLRDDPHGNREYLSPEVYAHFVERVALLGGESTGKSTLARALAQHFRTVHVDEYGRTLWEAQGGELTEADLLQIATTQVAHEDQAAQRAKRYLFCDTSPLTTRLYSEWMFSRVDPRLEALASHSYTLTILCAPDFAFQQDGTRRDEAFRAQQHERYLAELERRSVPYLLVEGDLERRVRTVARALGATA
jgi:NadR type nicotinamide-nucleotide adenylyltransferase